MIEIMLLLIEVFIIAFACIMFLYFAFDTGDIIGAIIFFAIGIVLMILDVILSSYLLGVIN